MLPAGTHFSAERREKVILVIFGPPGDGVIQSVHAGKDIRQAIATRSASCELGAEFDFILGGFYCAITAGTPKIPSAPSSRFATRGRQA
jgi:hypothetical protein